jgi:hypothetical protein
MTEAAIATTVPAYITSAIADGYIYECACGELYKMAAGALCCRKCRNYCAFGYCTHVVDITTGEVVAGTEPTAEEAAEAQELAEARWAEEREEWQHQLALMQGEGELYEQIMAERAAEAAIAAANLAMDNHYAIQDELMGY